MRKIVFFRWLLLALAMLATSAASFAQVGVAIIIAPPELPVYDQPPCPEEGYIWTPGYWAWGDDDYFWVPGTWVLAPEVGFLWTPGYWAWGGDSFVFYDGYWGPEVGFYGGVVYGFGYFGHGYEGGRWDNGHFFYNREVNNVNITVIHNVYSARVTNVNVTRVSYNGGNGGINERPTSQEEAVARQRHIAPISAQTQHVQAARANPQLKASVNRGKPPVAATPKPGALNDRAIVPAKEGGRYTPPANRTANAQPNGENSAGRRPTATHPKDLPPVEHPAAPSTGNAKLDKKYQQQQDQLIQKQNQERQKLQQKQDQEHQRLAQQKADDTKKQQVEQKHQQQTQQLTQKHEQQQQHLQQRQPAPHPKKP